MVLHRTFFEVFTSFSALSRINDLVLPFLYFSVPKSVGKSRASSRSDLFENVIVQNIADFCGI